MVGELKLTITLSWLAIGLLGTLIAIFTFKQKDSTITRWELVQAATAPFLGIVIWVLIFIDLKKKKKNAPHS